MSVPWLIEKNGALELHIWVQPGAKKSEIVGVYNQMLKIKIAAPPVDGKANQCITEYLAEKLKIRKQNILLIRGETSRQKVFAVSGLTREQIELCIGS